MTTQIVPPPTSSSAATPPPPLPTPVLSEDELLNLVTRASALQQSGLVDQAIETDRKSVV